MKRSSLYCALAALLLIFGTSVAGAYTVDLTGGKGETDTWDGALFVEFDDAMQTTVSSGTGVIDPFLTVQANTREESFNSDYFPVLDATRPHWNHSLQVSDLIVGPDYPDYFEFLVDINEPDGNKSLLTQHQLQVFIVPNAFGGSLSTYDALQSASGGPIWDLDRIEDSRIEFDYGIWNGSGQNIDAGFYLPTSLFSEAEQDDYVYLFVEFGKLVGNDGSPSQDGFEEYVRRASVPEPSTLLLLGGGLFGLAGFRRKFKK